MIASIKKIRFPRQLSNQFMDLSRIRISSLQMQSKIFSPTPSKLRILLIGSRSQTLERLQITSIESRKTSKGSIEWFRISTRGTPIKSTLLCNIGKFYPNRRWGSFVRVWSVNGTRSTRSTRRQPMFVWWIQLAWREERRDMRSSWPRSRRTSRSSTNYMFLLND